jgi:glycosyltransferase involved in cell wall biosynthesis
MPVSALHNQDTLSPERLALTGENIICFAKDWSEIPTSNNHVMRLLARENRVLWLNSIATRVPSLRSGRDVRKIGQKLVGFLRGPKQVEENMWVYTPLVLPLPHSRIAAVLNLWILRMTLALLRRRLGMPAFQLWTFLPNTADYVGRLGESLVVYYCVDEWSQFHYLDGQRMEAMERTLCRRADIVFATARTLAERKAPYNPETHLALHGVDHALFSRALEKTTPVPSDLAALPQPVLGFFGTLQDWVDQELLAYLARRHPEWTFVLLGDELTDLSRLKAYPNIHFLGRKPHTELPGYCKGFAVGLIPYILDGRMRYINPLKLREYLSAGLPVVSTAIPEVFSFADRCTIADRYEAFERGVTEALRSDTPERRRQRSAEMRAETWEQKVAKVSAQVLQVKRKRCQKQPDTVPA